MTEDKKPSRLDQLKAEIAVLQKEMSEDLQIERLDLPAPQRLQILCSVTRLRRERRNRK